MTKPEIHTLQDLRKYASEEDVRRCLTEYTMEVIAKADAYDGQEGGGVCREQTEQ